MDSEILSRIDEALRKYTPLTMEEFKSFHDMPKDYVEEEVYELLHGLLRIESAYCRLLALSESEREARAIVNHLNACVDHLIENIPRTFVLAWMISMIKGRENVRVESGSET